VPGLAQDVPVVADVEAAMGHNPTTLLIGVAPAGGKLPPDFRRSILQAIERGLDVESGLHEFLSDDAEISAAAERAGVGLRDLRRVPDGLDVPTGANIAANAASCRPECSSTERTNIDMCGCSSPGGHMSGWNNVRRTRSLKFEPQRLRLSCTARPP